MTKHMKIGSLIRVRDWEDQVLERRIVNICGNLVFVCTDQELANAKNEGRSPITVGWPIEAAGL